MSYKMIHWSMLCLLIHRLSICTIRDQWTVHLCVWEYECMFLNAYLWVVVCIFSRYMCVYVGAEVGLSLDMFRIEYYFWKKVACCVYTAHTVPVFCRREDPNDATFARTCNQSALCEILYPIMQCDQLDILFWQINKINMNPFESLLTSLFDRAVKS